jgi:hypothetical protein
MKGSIEGNGKTREIDGTVSMSSVGKETVDGEACRWIEFQLIFKREGKTQILHIKSLVPEKQLVAGKSPVAHVKKTWFKRGNRLPQELTDLSHRNAGSLPAYLAGPFEDAKKLEAKTVNSGLGKLECKGVTGSTKYRQGSTDFKYTFTNRLSDKAPFGVVTSEMKIEVTRKGRQTGSAILTLKAVKVGKKAVTAISHAKISNTKIVIRTVNGPPTLKEMGARIQKDDDGRVVSIHLSGPQVTDAGLEHLKGLTSLKSLSLHNTQVTGAGVKMLKQALPNCSIRR